MTVAMYSPVGFRRAPLLRHQRGMGDAAADYRAQAAQYTPGSVDYQFLMGCANNPTAPACAAEVSDVLSAPFVPVSAQGPIQAAIQSGGQLPTVKTISLAPTAAQLAPPPPPAPAQPISGGNVNIAFSTSSGNTSNPSVGDQWTISISGARPHDPVSVTGGQNGAMNDSYVGRADANGNFSKSGTFTADQVGAWTEQWIVNGVPVGSWNFFVTAPPAPAMQPAGFQSPNPPAGSNQQQQAQQQIQQQGASNQAGASASFFSQTAFGIPVWILLAAGVGVFFVFGQQGGHYGR